MIKKLVFYKLEFSEVIIKKNLNHCHFTNLEEIAKFSRSNQVIVPVGCWCLHYSNQVR